MSVFSTLSIFIQLIIAKSCNFAAWNRRKTIHKSYSPLLTKRGVLWARLRVVSVIVARICCTPLSTFMCSIPRVTFTCSDAQSGKTSSQASGILPSVAILTMEKIPKRREVREELGITDFAPIAMGKYVFESLRERELVYVHRTIYDGPIQPSQDELDGGRFWSLLEIRDAIGQGILTPNFESEFQRFFLSLQQ